jgi:flagellar assembly factor FliW
MESTTEQTVEKTVTQNTVTFPRFGECSYAESDVITFPWGIPGFAGHHRWLILTLDSQPGYVWLQSLNDLSVALPAANPWSIFESYDPKLAPYAFISLDIKSAAEFTLLCVVVATPGGDAMTMNLAAPIVINLRTRNARQVFGDNPVYSSSEPIPRTASQQQAELASRAS